MLQGSHPELDESPECWSLEDVVLEDNTAALSNHNQFVAHRGSGCIRDSAIQLPPGTSGLTAATHDLDEA
jgi:hypothetical protein